MRWQGRRESGNIEDRRGTGMGVGLPVGGGIGGIVLLLLFSALTGTNPLDMISTAPSPETTGTTGARTDDPASRFVSVVLADTEETFQQLFADHGGTYEPPVLVLFTDATQSACGVGQSAMGPFYCPLDEKVYIDLGFYRELKRRFGAPGDFAQAYVIAHEMGHHVQNILGISEKVRNIQQQRPNQANEISVRLELQADCLAGVWGASTAKRDILEADDVDEALNAAAAIGDDRIQGRGANPETFTHGSSRQRVAWFRRGFQSGRIDDCDTFRTQIPEDG